MIVFGIIVGILVLAMGIGAAIQSRLTKKQLEEGNQKGKLIEVDGGRINVYSEGSGKDTIVILAGYGVGMPIAEYGPLLRALKQDYRVVICDYKGVGFSSQTSKLRSAENIVAETREALTKAGFEPPYILMPHSIGGIYSEYYAYHHPQEVSGMILLDATPSLVPDGAPPASATPLKVAKFIQDIGLLRLLIGISPLPYSTEKGYTLEEIGLIRNAMARVYNETTINQGMAMVESIKKLESMKLPDGIPVIKLLAKQTLELGAKQFKTDPMILQQKHLDKLGNDVSYKIVEGSHNMAQENVNEVAQLAKDFIETYINV